MKSCKPLFIAFLILFLMGIEVHEAFALTGSGWYYTDFYTEQISDGHYKELFNAITCEKLNKVFPEDWMITNILLLKNTSVGSCIVLEETETTPTPTPTPTQVPPPIYRLFYDPDTEVSLEVEEDLLVGKRIAAVLVIIQNDTLIERILPAEIVDEHIISIRIDSEAMTSAAYAESDALLFLIEE